MTKFVIHNHLPAQDALSKTAQAQMRNNAGSNRSGSGMGSYRGDPNRSMKSIMEEINRKIAGNKATRGSNDASDHAYQVGPPIEGGFSGNMYTIWEGAGVDGGRWFVKRRGKTVHYAPSERLAKEWAEHS